MKNSIFLLVALVLVTGCGIKGAPRPPDEPPKIGTGQPNYVAPVPKSGADDLYKNSDTEDADDKEEKSE